MKSLMKSMCITLSGLVLIFGPAVVFASDTHVSGLASNGNMVAVWQAFTPDGTILLASIYNINKGVWDEPVTISSSDTASDPFISIISNNQDISIVLTWKEACEGYTALYGKMRADLNSGWSNSIKISEDLENVLKQNDLQMTTSGKIMASWSSFNAQEMVQGRFATSLIGLTNTWSAPMTPPGY